MPHKKKKRPVCFVPFPFEPLVQHLVGILIDHLNNTNELLKLHPQTIRNRNNLAKSVVLLPLINKESHRLANEVKHFGVCVSFEAARLCATFDKRLFDSMHADVDPLHGLHSGCETTFFTKNNHMSPVAQVKLEASDSAALLARETNTLITKLLDHHDCPDLQDAPRCVRVFVGRVRYVSQFVASHSASTDRCRVCGRETILYDDCEGDLENEAEKNYWEAAGGIYTTEETLPVCCGVCKNVLVQEIDRARGVSKAELVSYDTPPNTPQARRVSMALRAAFKRNEMVARRHRSTGQFRILAPWEITEARTKTATALNTDVGLLLACEQAVTLPRYKTKMMPPCFLRWRTNRSVFLNKLLRVSQIYRSFAPKRAVVLPHLLHKPRWVIKVMESAAYIVN